MMPQGLRPIRCAACGKLICEADGTVVFRCPRCKRRTVSASSNGSIGMPDEEMNEAMPILSR